MATAKRKMQKYYATRSLFGQKYESSFETSASNPHRVAEKLFGGHIYKVRKA